MEKDLCLLFPLIGMEWNGQSIRFGDSRQALEAILGAPEAVHGARVYYFSSELAFDFDGQGNLEFIECLGGPEGRFQPKLYHLPVFQTDADELLEVLKERNGPDMDDSEAEYSYALRELSIGLYREITPGDVEEMVREMTRIDLTNLSHIDLDAEQTRARRWATIGIGRKNYYA